MRFTVNNSDGEDTPIITAIVMLLLTFIVNGLLIGVLANVVLRAYNLPELDAGTALAFFAFVVCLRYPPINAVPRSREDLRKHNGGSHRWW